MLVLITNKPYLISTFLSLFLLLNISLFQRNSLRRHPIFTIKDNRHLLQRVSTCFGVGKVYDENEDEQNNGEHNVIPPLNRVESNGVDEAVEED